MFFIGPLCGRIANVNVDLCPLEPPFASHFEHLVKQSTHDAPPAKFRESRYAIDDPCSLDCRRDTLRYSWGTACDGFL